MPSTVPPQQSKGDRESEELEESVLKAASLEREAGMGGEEENSAREEGRENMASAAAAAAAPEVPSEDVIREETTPPSPSSDQIAGFEELGGGSVDDVSRSSVAGMATVDREGEYKREEQDASIISEAFMHGEGKPQGAARVNASGVKNIPRMVKRSRSRVLRVEKSYSWMLNGMALEVRW